MLEEEELGSAPGMRAAGEIDLCGGGGEEAAHRFDEVEGDVRDLSLLKPCTEGAALERGVECLEFWHGELWRWLWD